MNKDLHNLRKAREEIIEVLKRNGVIIAARNYQMGAAITLIDEVTGTVMMYNGQIMERGGYHLGVGEDV